jgi:hypothetical protein
MADIIDIDSDDSTQNELEQFDAPKAEIKAEPAPDDDLPEKFKGKSAKDIAKAYEEIEKMASRQAQEVGELRKLTDGILKSQLASKQPEPQQAQELDFFDDPKEAVRQVVENHPAVVQAKQTSALLKAQSVKQALEQKHGKIEDYAQDPDFVNYVKASNVRLKLMAAAENYDFEAADELLSNYKEIKSAKAAKQADQQTEFIKADRDKSLKAAAVPMGSGSGESSKKIYRRADLIRLMRTDPRRYEAMQDEIMAAYNSGRVK